MSIVNKCMNVPICDICSKEINLITKYDSLTNSNKPMGFYIRSEGRDIHKHMCIGCMQFVATKYKNEVGRHCEFCNVKIGDIVYIEGRDICINCLRSKVKI